LLRLIKDHYRFFRYDEPPAWQQYRGFPGIHVQVYNPPQDECYMTCGLENSFETTVVRAHTFDGPFIFDSLRNYFRKAGIMVYSSIHPIVGVERREMTISGITSPAGAPNCELLVHFTIEKIVNKERRQRIEEEIFAVLKSLFLGVEDFQAMLDRTGEVVRKAEDENQCGIAGEPACEFINWLKDNNFIYMGMTRYMMEGNGASFISEPDAALGVFREPSLIPVVFPGLQEEIQARLQAEAPDERTIDIDYCGNTSAIYHLEPVDYVAIRQRNRDGALVGVTLILGRFAVGAMLQKSGEIPLLREKLAWLLKESGARKDSFYYRETRRLFSIFPKRESFYANSEALKSFIDAVVSMTSDDEVIVRSRPGTAGRYHVLYIAFSHARFSHQVEDRIIEGVSHSIGPVQYHTDTDGGTVEMLALYLDASRMTSAIDYEAVKSLVAEILMTWDDRAIGFLTRALGEHEGFSAYYRYRATFSSLYREVTPPAEVPDDLAKLKALDTDVLVRVLVNTPTTAVLKLYSRQAILLMEILPTLKNLGLAVVDEVKVLLDEPEGGKVHLYRFNLEMEESRLAQLSRGEARVQEAIARIITRDACDDEMGILAVTAGLTWREVELLRTIRNHLVQIRQHYNAITIDDVISRYPEVAAALVRYFTVKFNPEMAEAKGVTPESRASLVTDAEKAVLRGLDAVRSLAEDEILRGLFNVMQAAVRTNYFATPQRPVISIKVLCGRIDAMPSPRPMAEIYAHSPLLEGIHLRGGKVARGGIRWSDRHDDFRTEVLGLMKTQMVKNSIIVPVGSKGGFVLKGRLPSKPEMGEYLKARYREYIEGLLDITDNIVDGKVVHPEGLVVHDDPDPYLVVAADKGTAHLSDDANAVSARYRFWLGDAFASGGSRGYDHKKVGITARGAWVCCQRHFREMDVDVQSQPVTAAGIGDMAGDVFGNGLLRSSAVKLVAAFNHAHIFLDPDPDTEASFRERERLFRLPGSGWHDYNADLISKGGGIFDRSAKSVPLSPEVGKMLGVKEAALSGEELIRRILMMEVDLLYNGGIGTYVKGTTESHGDVGDRNNDRVRVNGADVRAKVIVEGGNLGMTQKGRLEYWMRGGRCNTDAVDNSGGVDMSDHEVNIKILLNLLVDRGIMTAEEQGRLLAAMTDEVAELVLEDNYLQSLAISLDSIRSLKAPTEIQDLIAVMKKAGVLVPQDESIPSTEELSKMVKKGRGLPRPMLAVLLGYQKMWSYHRILESSLPDSPTAEVFLLDYFPVPMRERYRASFADHPLRREIIATVMVNHVINCAGVGFLAGMEKKTGRKLAEIMEVYLAAEKATGAEELRRQIMALDLLAPTDEQYALLLAVEERLAAATVRLLTGQGVTVFPEELASVREKLRSLSVCH
ncbi:MAG: NAD-glutamate dehydrogenase, partial [Nitrospirota bacterium]|nr:NAD-glutamate dehydrogenase [Nitrospirota bacterium]